jgi:hypothetical protein
LTTAAPAAASPGSGAVCTLLQNTWLRNRPWGDVLLTLSAGRGFRIHQHVLDPWSNSWWFYGHGAEAPDLDGWIPVNNCASG